MSGMTDFEKEKALWRQRQSELNHEDDELNGFSNSDNNGHSRTYTNEDAIAKAERLQQANKESLGKSIQRAKEATMIGTQTLEKLENQTEQFKEMDQDLDATNASYERSNRTRRSLNSFGGYLSNFFAPKSQHKDRTLNADAIKVSPAKTSSSAQHHHKPQHEVSSEEQKPRSINEIDFSKENLDEETLAAIEKLKVNENGENDQIGQLDELLLQLKGQAAEMNKHIKVHDKLIDHVETEIDRANGRSAVASKSVTKILKS